MKERLKSVWLVVPCFNEEEVLPESAKQMRKKLEELIRKRKVSAKSRIVLVDDGSKDRTWKIIEKFAKDKRFLGVKLSRNFGHQAALLAGLEVAKEADAVITIDADLQDDLGAVEEMMKKFKGGAEIVFGVRKSREKDTWFKRGSAGGFYKLMNLLGARTVENSADFRLMSKKAIDELEKYQEVNLFLRGIVPEIGFKTEIVEYDRKERLAGKSKYPLGKMIHFAIEGITSFSTKPIKLVFLLGAVISVLSAGVLAYALVVKFLGQTVSGWTFIIVSIWLLGGGQMLAIGIVGEYVGKIYLETKRRPRYIIEKVSRK